ncbi:hypothetical protein M1B72_01675 [Geomonas paludis]|uniref:Uncharacterized protein n=1 Tax=Geomonas paludis TaxID=2740185 RepID=A0ABY4LF81_9BACT|nr:hypothetical protein [Geomonas paludis]UPU36439.1 hypothetical protein M1B72_01675 [Geomonas paludis]
MERTVASVQGAYFLTTGLWPIFSIRTFMMITGPKTDLWLVKTVGAVLAVIGAALLVAGIADQVTQALVLLAVGSAAALAAVDVIYASRKVIAPVYLLDAVLEAALILWWVAALLL